MWTTVVPVALAAHVAVASAEPLPPPYYIGEVLPTPKQATYYDAFLELYDVKAGKPLATIVIDEEPAEAQRLAVEELVSRILELAAADESIPITAQMPTGGAVVRFTCQRGALLSEDDTAAMQTVGEQGYLIRSAETEPAPMVLGAANGAPGIYYAAQSLKQLLVASDGKVLLRRADITDYPTFEHRSTYAKVAEAAWLGFCKYNVFVGFGYHGRDNWRLPYHRVGGWNRAGWESLRGDGYGERLMARHKPHSGRRCARLELMEYKPTGPGGKPDFISTGLVLGGSDGREGKDALAGEPGKYDLTFWLRGDVPQVDVEVVGWTAEEGTPDSRTVISTDLGPLLPVAEWRQYDASFVLGEEVKRWAVLFGVTGHREAGYHLGQCLFLDDVVLTRQGSGENLAWSGNAEGSYANGIAEGLGWALPRGLTPVQSVWPLNVKGWEDGGRLKIRCSDARDIDALAETLRVSLDLGATWVRLGLDDHSSKQRPERLHYVLTQKADREVFRSLGEAHGTLVRGLYERLKATHPHCRLIVCPAYYHNHNRIREEGPQDYIDHQEQYLRKFGSLVPADVLIEWSGSGQTSAKITKEDVDYFARLIGRTPLYWDNSYSNVSLYLPADRDYPERLWEMVAGVHLCGSGPSYLVDHLRYADYLWNPEAHDPSESWPKAIEMVLGEGLADPWLRFRDEYLPVATFEYGLVGGSDHLSQLSDAELRDRLAQRYGFKYGLQKLESMLRSIGEMEQSLATIRDRSPNTEHVAALENIAAPYSAQTERLRDFLRGEQ